MLGGEKRNTYSKNKVFKLVFVFSPPCKLSLPPSALLPENAELVARLKEGPSSGRSALNLEI